MMKRYDEFSDEFADLECYMDEIRPSKRKYGYVESTGLTKITLKGVAEYLDIEYTGEDVVYGKIKRS